MHSIVEYYAGHEGYKCGYCKSLDTNFSHGMWAHSLTVSDYQDLIDRGWRRSGKYCYKPTMDVTCCPMYTIRCRVLEFKASKSQKKVLKKFNKYFLSHQLPNSGGDHVRKMSMSSETDDEKGDGEGEGRELFVEPSAGHQDICVKDVVKPSDEEIEKDMLECESGDKDISSSTELLKEAPQTNKEKEVRKGSGADPTKMPCKKAKQLRLERKLQKLKEKGVDITTLPGNNKNKEKQLEDFINELPEEFKKKLQIKLVRTNPASPEWIATSKETHEVYVKYQMIIHNDKPDKCTEEKFRDFLVNSPLLEEHTESAPACGYGSFHQQYWLDEKIVAVGVIDILPKCVSSVYFFYDPQYMQLSLGTYGALREIEFTRNLNTQSPQLKYYYMGFYIHSCRKMRYKGNYYPSDLVCPETYKWFPLKDCIPKLEASPYSRLDPDIDSVDENYPNDAVINYIPVLFKGIVYPYKVYRRKYSKKKDDLVEVVEYARLVGAKCSKSLILAR